MQKFIFTSKENRLIYADRPTQIKIESTSDIPINPSTEETLLSIAGLVTSAYDYISLSYTGTNLTGVVYKTGGAGGTTVSTLTLVYDGSDQLTSVTKS